LSFKYNFRLFQSIIDDSNKYYLKKQTADISFDDLYGACFFCNCSQAIL